MPNARRLLCALPLLALAAACANDAARGPAALQRNRPVQLDPPARPGLDGPVGLTAIETPAPIWYAPVAEIRSTAEVMIEADRTAPALDDWRDRPRARKLRPNRESLPQHPLSLAPRAFDPPRTLFRGGVPSVAQTAVTPNVDVATVAETQSLPPDTMGDIGPTQYLVGLNGLIRTINKTTGARDNVLSADFDVFFPSSLRNGAFTSDPRVRYDRRTGRWFVVMITVAVPNRFLVAVSSSATISAGTTWAQYQWTNTRRANGSPSGASCLADYPTLGLDEDALYIGVNQFCGSSLSALGFDSTSAYVLNKTALVNGTLSVAEFDGVLPDSTAAGIYTPQGVDNLDSGTTAGYFIGVDNLSAGALVMKRVSNPDSSPSLSANITVPVDSTSFPVDVPHPSGGLPLDGLDDRLLQAVIRSGRLWTTHQVAVNTAGVASNSGTRTAVRWYELQNLSGSPSVAQSGTVFDSAASTPIHYWMGAIMPNGQGHVALGMSKAGATTRVNTAFTGRLRTDPAGAMDAPTQYSSNTSFAYNQQSSPELSQRWGDYSYTSVDPDDDMTFWTLQQYVDGNNSYAVRLLRLLAPAPAAITTVSPSTVAAGLLAATVTVTGSPSGGRGFFDPGAGFARRIAASVSGTGVTVTNVVVNNPTSVTLTLNTIGAATGQRALTVTNPDGQTSTLANGLTIGASGPNQAPIFTATPGATTIFDGGSGGTTGALAISVIDPEGTPVVLTAATSNPTVIPQNRITLGGSGTSRTVTVTSAGVLGASTITLTASDGTLTSTANFVVTVSASAVPGAPQGFAAIATRNRVDFSWQPPSGSEPVLGYRIEAGYGPGGTVATIPVGSATTYIVYAAPDGVFYARVRAQTAAGLGPPSPDVVFATGQAGPPLAPRALLATVQDTNVAMQWTENLLGPVIAGYQLQAGSGPGLTDIAVLPLPPTARSLAVTAPPGTYYVRVVAVNAAGGGAASNEATLVAQPGTCTIPALPLGLAASVTSTRLTATWNAPLTGAIPTAYVIQAGTTSGAANWGTFSFPGTTTAVSGLVPRGPYFLRLFASNVCGTSAASAEVSITVP
jgi:hypothetical protein